MTIYEDAIQNRYDFVLLFDCINGNPNGDPDAGNLPRIDPMTSTCLVTDACLKRKIRDEIDLRYGDKPGMKMYIKNDRILNLKDEEAFTSVGATDATIAEYRKGHPDVEDLLRKFMCENYYDIRTFGGVMTKFSKANLSCGGVRGPVQISCAESISPVELKELAMVRTIVATEDEVSRGMTTFAPKAIIPYGLFRCVGSISANLAQKYTGFSEEDLAILWEGIINMFENDKAAVRPEMNVRKLIVFKHDSVYGNAPAHVLSESVHIQEKTPGKPIRSCFDYDISIDKAGIPESVEIIEKV